MKTYYYVDMWPKVWNSKKTFVHKILAKDAIQAEKQAEKFYPDYIADNIDTCFDLTYRDLWEMLSTMNKKQLNSKLRIVNEETKEEYSFPYLSIDDYDKPVLIV